MPFTFFDRFYVMDPYNPPPPGTVLNPVYLSVTDNNDNGLINRFSNDRIDGVDIRAAYPGDTVTVVLLDGSTVTYTGVTYYLADGRQVFTPTDGSNVQQGALVSTGWVSGQGSVTIPEFGPPCFTPGTLIATPSGPRPVEALRAGDLVLTQDRGAVPLLYLRRRCLDADHLRAHPRHAPVRIAAGALGGGLPQRDLVLSPQHRVVIRSEVARRMFDSIEILVAAVHLVGQPGITRLTPAAGVEYLHLLLDHHGIVMAEGAPTESLYLGERVHESLSAREIEVLRAKLPGSWRALMRPARPLVRGPRLRRLLERLSANGKPLLEPAAEYRMAQTG